MVKQRDGYHFDDVMEDGRTVRVPLLLCDSVDPQWAFHQRGYRFSDSVTAKDARSDALDARDAMIERLTSAWRRPVQHDAAEPDNSPPAAMRRRLAEEPDIEDAQARRDQAHRDYSTRLSEAWKNPPGRTDPHRASRIEQQREQVLGK